MEFVEPIRSKEKIADMKEYLLSHNERDYVLFVLGINSGLRISDLLRLTVEDVKDGSVSIKEKKTGKLKQFILSDTCKQVIKDYLNNSKITTGLLFRSKKGENKAISRVYAWKILQKAADYCGIKGRIGTHTLRKTAGYHALRQGIGIEYIMKVFNHSSPEVTKRYIGITEDELNRVFYSKMNL